MNSASNIFLGIIAGVFVLGATYYVGHEQGMSAASASYSASLNASSVAASGMAASLGAMSAASLATSTSMPSMPSANMSQSAAKPSMPSSAAPPTGKQ